MAATSRSIDYNKILSTTADKIHKSGAVQDAITSANPMTRELYTKGKIKKIEVGGEMISGNVMYRHNGTIDSYKDFEQINNDPQEFMTRWFMPWAQYGGAITLSGIQKFKNMGKEKIVSLMEQEVTAIVNGWAERLNKDLWECDNLSTSNPHPYTGNGGRNIASVVSWIQPHTTSSIAAQFTSMDIGLIDQSAETWWHNQVFDAGNSFTVDTIKSKLSNAYNSCGQYSGGYPDLGVMDQITYELLEQSMQDQVRYMSTDKASPGFENLYYKKMKLEWDGYVPDTETSGTNNGPLATGSALTKGSIFLINTGTMSLYVGKDHDWKPRGFQDAYNQDATSSLYLAYIQLVCDNRIKNGVMFDCPLTIST